jgi:hypothetical protein
VVIGVVETTLPVCETCSRALWAWLATQMLPTGSAAGNEKPKPAVVEG